MRPDQLDRYTKDQLLALHTAAYDDVLAAAERLASATPAEVRVLLAAAEEKHQHFRAIHMELKIRWAEEDAAARASCGHLADEDGECSCSYWPERAPYRA